MAGNDNRRGDLGLGIGRDANGNVLSRGAWAARVNAFNTGNSLSTPPSASELFSATTAISRLASAEYDDMRIANLKADLEKAAGVEVGALTFISDEYGTTRIDDVTREHGRSLRDPNQNGALEAVLEKFFDSGENLPTQHENVERLPDGSYALNLGNTVPVPSSDEYSAASLKAERAQLAHEAASAILIHAVLAEELDYVDFIEATYDGATDAFTLTSATAADQTVDLSGVLAKRPELASAVQGGEWESVGDWSDPRYQMIIGTGENLPAVQHALRLAREV